MSQIGPSPFSSSRPSGPSGRPSTSADAHPQDEVVSPALPLPARQQGGHAQEAPVSSLFTADLRLNAVQTARLLRHLLQLPAEMVALLAMLAQLDSASASELLKNLTQEQVDISLTDLQTLLLEKLAQSEEKLLKLMQSGSTGNTASLFELLRLRGELVERTEHSPAEALRTLILLYLPSYPLQDAQRVSLLFLPPVQSPSEGNPTETDDPFGEKEQKSGEEQAGPPENAIRWMIILQTLSLGSFHILMSISRPVPNRSVKTELWVRIGYAPQALPALEEIRLGIETIAKLENQASPTITFTPLRQEPSNKKNLPADEDGAKITSTPSVSIHPADDAPALGIHWAYRLTRLILDIDNARASSPESQQKDTF